MDPALARTDLESPPASPNAERELEERLDALWESPPGLKSWFATVDHKELGKRYLWTAVMFLLIGGVEALMIRAQLSRAEQRLMSPEAYDQIFTMHGVTMIFWYASPVLSGFGNYLIPLLLGSRDMAFPRVNAFSYWSYLFSGLFLYASVFLGQSPHAGWFAYAPYTIREFSPGLGMDFYALALIFLGISTTGGAINFIVTILRHRAEGMTLSRMPLLMYSTLTVSFSIVFALPALTAACVFLELDRWWGFHFFDPSHGGNVLLWQHLFWFFGHPWVYVIFLPATGMVSMLLPVFARRPIVGYPYVAFGTVMTGVVGFGVWVHHMFSVGLSGMGMSFFSAASMTISMFSAVQVFAWLATLWAGRPVMSTSLLFALGFLSALVIGGLSGVVTAVIPFDWQLHDTYFVVAHLHYVLVGANVFPVFAAFYYWLPKMNGRKLDETLGRWSFWLMLVGFNVTFFPMHLTGLLGMPRRVFTYPVEAGWEGLNLTSTAGALILTVGILISLVNFVRSLRGPAQGSQNPWNADSLEWLTSSPPKAYAFAHLPLVQSRHPLWDGTDPVADPEGRRTFTQDRLTLSTSALDARAVAVAKMPEDTLMPVLAALVLMGLFTALLCKALWVAAGTAVLALLVLAAWQWPESKPAEAAGPAPALPIDDRRGLLGMNLLIATEATFFVMLFFAYFYLVGATPPVAPPKVQMALIMLGLLLASSGVLVFGEQQAKQKRFGLARASLVGTVALGAAFLGLMFFEYRDHLRTLTPQANAYGSIFYTITSFHALHLTLGLCLLLYVLFLPNLGSGQRPPHRPLGVVSRYWHFVDVVWIFVVVILYLLPAYTS